MNAQTIIAATPLSWAECHALGITAKEAAEARGSSPKAARAWARHHGLKFATAAKVIHDAEVSAGFARCMAAGMTAPEAARELGSKKSTAHSWAGRQKPPLKWPGINSKYRHRAIDPAEDLPPLSECEIDPVKCLDMWCEVLGVGLFDALDGQPIDCKIPKVRIARDWFGSADFNTVCNLIGVEPSRVAARAKTAIERGEMYRDGDILPQGQLRGTQERRRRQRGRE